MKMCIFFMAVFFIGSMSYAEHFCSATCVAIDKDSEFVDAVVIEGNILVHEGDGESKKKAFDQIVIRCQSYPFRSHVIVSRLLAIEYTMGSKKIKSDDNLDHEQVIPGMYLLNMIEANEENCLFSNSQP